MGAVAVVASCSVPAVAEAAENAEFGARTLKPGARGRDVRVLQDFLSRAGLATDVDGHFGPGTRAKVREWERAKLSGSAGATTGASAASGVRADGRLTRVEAAVLRRDVEAAESGQAPPAAAPVATETPGEAATLVPDGTAIAPAAAPEAVKQIIAAGNEIHAMPYRYGGGHAPPPNKAAGYDCSGSMSYAFQGAGLLKNALDSTGFASWGDAGPGRWVTIYANAGHSFMVVAGLRFDTSGRRDAGSRWQARQRPGAGYSVRHPAGL